MLDDIGGLYGIFFDFFGPIVVMLLVGDEALMAIAFKLTDMGDDVPISSNSRISLSATYVNKSTLITCWLKLQIKLTNCFTRFLCFCCCRSTMLEDRIKIGREIVQKELDVSFLLKRLHVLEGIAKETLSLAQWTSKWKTYEKPKLSE